MTRKVTLRLSDVEQEITELGEKLKTLQAVANFIKSSEQTKPSGGGAGERRVRGGVVKAVREFVKLSGPCTTTDVIKHVQLQIPSAPTSTVRSTCSVLAKKGEFRRDELSNKWVFVKEP